MSSIKYRPEIDGLRSIAILGVLIFHFNEKWLKGGFLGVDVFFVISGYLITSIIVNELNAGTFSLKNFWERRVRRIFPALAFMLLVFLLLAFILFVPPADLSSQGRQSLKVLALVSNQYMLSLAGDYWGADASTISLLHTWSLSIEEQFYVFLPIILLLVYKCNLRKFVFELLIGVFIGSLAWCIIQSPVDQSSAFFYLSTRAWELLAGSILAIIAPRISSKITSQTSNFLSLLGLFIVILSYILIEGTGFPGWKGCVPVLGTILFIGFSSSNSFAGSCLSNRNFVYVGKVSYSLYLWHWPFLVLGKILADIYEIQEIRHAAFFISIIVALLSFHYIEPIGKKIKNIWVFFISSLIVIVAIGLLASFNSRNLANLEFFATTSKLLVYECKQSNRKINNFSTFEFRGIDLVKPDNLNTNSNYDIVPRHTSQESKTEIIVLGDSHGLMWASLIERVANKNNTGAIFWTTHGVPPFLESNAVKKMNFSAEQRAELNRLKLESIKINKPKLVMIITRLDTKWNNDSAEISGFRFKELIEAIHNLSPNSRVLILDQPPMCHFGNQNAAQWLGMRNKYFICETVPNLNLDSWKKGNDFISRLPNLYPFVDFVQISDIYLDAENRIKLVEGKHILYLDDDHLSEYGASLAQPRIQHAIERVLKL